MMATTIYLAFVGLILTFSTSWVVGSAYASVSSTAPVASFVAIDHGFQGPDTLRAGLTTLRLHNRGREPHQLQLLKLTEGKSPGDLAASLRGPHAQVPHWAKHMGGPNGVGSGETAEATVYLEPGTYVIICAIPTKEQQLHAAVGMQKTLQVIGGGSPGQDFIGNVHMAMFDFEFVVVQNMRRGEQTFYVVNRGNQTHQVSLVQLDSGASPEDMLAAFGKPPAPLPGKLLGGMAGLEPGGRGMFTASLAPGRYAMMCLFPNPTSHDNHAAKGMVMNFTVE